METFADESGVKNPYVVLDDGGQRRLKLQSFCGVTLEENLMSPEKQIRPAQGADLKNCYVSDWRSHPDAGAPRAMSSSPMTPESIRVMVQKRKDEIAQATALQSLAIRTERPPQTLQEGTVAEGGPDAAKEDEAEIEEMVVGELVMPSQRRQQERSGRGRGAGRASGKKEGRGRGGRAATVVSAVAASARSEVGGDSGPIVYPEDSVSCVGARSRSPFRSARSEAPSVVGRRKNSSSGVKTTEDHVRQLDVEKILAGENLGHIVYNARRFQQGLAEKETTQPEAVVLQHHIDLAAVAQETPCMHLN